MANEIGGDPVLFYSLKFSRSYYQDIKNRKHSWIYQSHSHNRPGFFLTVFWVFCFDKRSRLEMNSFLIVTQFDAQVAKTFLDVLLLCSGLFCFVRTRIMHVCLCSCCFHVHVRRFEVSRLQHCIMVWYIES